MKKLNVRTVALSGVLLAVGGVYVFNLWDTNRLKQQVQAKAAEHVEEFTNGPNAMPEDRVTSAVTVSRPYVMFGPPTAKISVFTRPATAEEDAPYTGVEYFYTKSGDEWRFNESARCSGESCQLEAQTAFQAATR